MLSITMSVMLRCLIFSFICFYFSFFIDAVNVSTSSTNSSHAVSFDTFPFLSGLSNDAKNQFTNILWAWNVTFADKNKQLDAWAAGQSPQIKEQYETWATEALDFIKTMIQRHKEKSQMLSPAAQAADNIYVKIWENENLTPQEKCLQLLDLYNQASDQVRREARLHRPVGSNCTMPKFDNFATVAPSTL